MKQQPQQRSLLNYFGRRAIIVCIVLLIGLLAMITVMKISSCMVLAGEAMEVRAEYILTYSQNSRGRMESYFSDEYIASEELAAERARYEDYDIARYSENPKVTWIWVWPWSNTATVRVHDEVKNIAGQQLETADTKTKGIPQWQTGSYTLKMKKIEGTWLITEVKAGKLDPTPTPSPSASPSPQS